MQVIEGEGAPPEGPEEIRVVDHRVPPFIDMTPGQARYTAEAIEAFAEATLMDVRDGEIPAVMAPLAEQQSVDALAFARYLRSWAQAWSGGSQA